MSPNIILKPEFSQVGLTPPVKYKSKYTSFVSNGREEPLYVQTPLAVIKDVTDASISLEPAQKGAFHKLFAPLEDQVINVIVERSSEFFKGKRFSYDHINKAVSRILDANEVFSVNVNWDNVLIRDQHNKEKSWTDLSVGTECTALVHFQRIQYGPYTFEIVAEVCQIKCFMQNKLKEWAILDFDNNDAETVARWESDAVPLQQIASEMLDYGNVDDLDLGETKEGETREGDWGDVYKPSHQNDENSPVQNEVRTFNPEDLFEKDEQEQEKVKEDADDAKGEGVKVEKVGKEEKGEKEPVYLIPDA